MSEHGATVEADLLRFYQVDLLDLYRGRLSARRCQVLIRALPADSATARAVVADDGWTLEHHLLAAIHDQIAVLGWMYASAHSKQAPRRPDPLPRPGIEAPPARQPWTEAQLARIGATTKIGDVVHA